MLKRLLELGCVRQIVWPLLRRAPTIRGRHAAAKNPHLGRLKSGFSEPCGENGRPTLDAPSAKRFAGHSLALASALLLAPSVPLLAAGNGEVTSIKLDQPAVAAAFRPRRLVLLLGVRSFEDSRFRDLKYPPKDVEDLRGFLATHNKAAGDEEIVLLDEGATNAKFAAALDELERKNTSADDIVLVYLSTHGTLAYDETHKLKRFAALRDTDFAKVSTSGISLEYLQNRLSRLRSSRKALILALCHSGTGKSQLPTELEKELTTLKADFFPQPLHEVSAATMILSASAWGQPAREDDALRNDIYTHFLLEGLERNDTDRDGAVSLFEAHEFARSRTYDYTRGLQTPTALLRLEGTDPIILNGEVRHESAPLIFADSEQFRTAQVFVDGNDKGTLWEPQRLPSGRVHLTLLDPGNPKTPLIDHDVFVQNGTAYAVSSLVQRPPSFGAEAQLLTLPLPAGIDGLERRDFITYGAGLRASAIMGSRFGLLASYATKTLAGESALKAPSILRASLVSSEGAASFYPRRDAVLSLGIGLARLAVERTVADDAYTRGLQKAAVVFPFLGAEARVLNVAGPVYAAVQLKAHPAHGAGLAYDGGKRALGALVSSAAIGYAF